MTDPDYHSAIRVPVKRKKAYLQLQRYTVKKEDDLHMKMQIIFLFVANPAGQMPKSV